MYKNSNAKESRTFVFQASYFPKKNFLQIRLYFTSSKMSNFQIEVIKKYRQLRIFIFG